MKEFTKERLTEIEASHTAQKYATVAFQRGHGGQVAHTWKGAKTLPVLVSSEMESQVEAYIEGNPELGIKKVRDIDDRTALYARP